jgi:type II secretory pathway pseudopilin PulG
MGGAVRGSRVKFGRVARAEFARELSASSANQPTPGPSLGEGFKARRRGVTLLETVFASVLLVMVATSVVSALSFMNASELRFKRQLAAFEVANRLLLQFLDDPGGMPDATKPYMDEESGLTFRWSFVLEPIKFSVPEKPLMGSASTSHGLKALDQSKVMRARVFMGVPDGIGGYKFGEQLAELSRPMNPIAAQMRNPDVAGRLTDPEKLGKFIKFIVDLQGDGKDASAAINSNTQSASGGASSTGVWARSSSGGSSNAAPFGNSVTGGTISTGGGK